MSIVVGPCFLTLMGHRGYPGSNTGFESILLSSFCFCDQKSYLTFFNLLLFCVAQLERELHLRHYCPVGARNQARACLGL